MVRYRRSSWKNYLLTSLAKELYRTGFDCEREGKFIQGIEALERSLAIYQQLANKGPDDYLHDRFHVWFFLSKCYRATKRTGSNLEFWRISQNHPPALGRGSRLLPPLDGHDSI